MEYEKDNISKIGKFLKEIEEINIRIDREIER